MQRRNASVDCDLMKIQRLDDQLLGVLGSNRLRVLQVLQPKRDVAREAARALQILSACLQARCNVPSSRPGDQLGIWSSHPAPSLHWRIAKAPVEIDRAVRNAARWHEPTEGWMTAARRADYGFVRLNTGAERFERV